MPAERVLCEPGVQTHPAAAPNFRKNINGLRGCAVLAVVLFHFGIPGFDGGYVGVDIFFVLSGYLMTQIITRRISDGRFSLVEFYVSRARRIVPALAFLLAAMLLWGFFYLTPFELRSLAKHAAASMGFVSNLTLWAESGYFTAGAEGKWLLHTWSLSVEWQFYVLFPLVVLATHRSGAMRSGICVLLAASLLGSIITTPIAPEAAFYLLPTRAWELLAGSMAYFAGANRDVSTRLEKWRSVGIVLILVPVAAFSAATPFPGYLAAIPTLGAALIIAAPDTGRLLQLRVLQFLGDISYSLYLWHWPLRVAARYFEWNETWSNQLLLVLLAILLAFCSYRLIEQPFRRRRPLQSEWVAALRYGSVIVLVAGISSVIIHGTARRIAGSKVAKQLLSYASYDYVKSYRQGTCFLQPHERFSAFSPECFGSQPSGMTVLWGDSHAAHLYPGLGALLPVAQLTTSACPPLVKFESSSARSCLDTNSRIVEWIARARPQRVIMAGYWLYYSKDTDVEASIRNTIAELKSVGIGNIVLVGPVPTWSGQLPVRLYRDIYKTGRTDKRTWRGIVDGGLKLDARMKDWAPGLGVRYVSLFDLLCSASGCITFFGDANDPVPVQWDDTHFTDMTARLAALEIIRSISDASR